VGPTCSEKIGRLRNAKRSWLTSISEIDRAGEEFATCAVCADCSRRAIHCFRWNSIRLSGRHGAATPAGADSMCRRLVGASTNVLGIDPYFPEKNRRKLINRGFGSVAICCVTRVKPINAFQSAVCDRNGPLHARRNQPDHV
jgi:hypothetical protein